jgi:hypothetical protein
VGKKVGLNNRENPHARAGDHSRQQRPNFY